jgi:tellurite resistance protein TerC
MLDWRVEVVTIPAMPTNWLFWVLFHVFVFAMLALDLGVFHRKARVIPFREALAWTAIWIALAAIFAVLIYFFGHAMTGRLHRATRVLSLEFITGYVVEEALSVDNLFVFLLLFRYFGVPGEYQHKVLFWGILGALVTRAVFILTGVTLVNRFHWVIYLFGVFLVYAGAKLFVQKDEDKIDPESNPVARFFRRHVAMVPDYGGGRFIVYRDGKRYATMLALVVVVVETPDVVFATDSIPAILAISRDPFIVYTSNVFAILGLRSLFFALAGMMKMFHLLNYGLSVILIFIGAKMLASSWWEMSTGWALAAVAGVLAVSVALSLAFPEKQKTAD